LVPLIVTAVPPVVGPLAGLTPLTDGGPGGAAAAPTSIPIEANVWDVLAAVGVIVEATDAS
jgi:hypothetical protein